jgi:hypothetical protein
MQVKLSEYDVQAQTFLSEAGIDFSFVLVGDDCPKFCSDAEKQVDMDKVNVFPRRTHIHGKHYRCTFTRRGKAFTLPVDYWNSYADEEFNAKKRGTFGNPGHRDWQITAQDRKEPKRTPSAYDVLTCITKNDPGTFEDFCGDFGYDEDSRKAEATYFAVRDEYKQVSRFFTVEELEKAQGIQ